MGYSAVTMHYHDETGETPALEDFTLSIAEGEFLAILGPSGCGKSTLLSLAAGILTPDMGEVTLHGEPVSGVSPRIGYMLQHDHLFPWLTIEDNALLGVRVRGKPTRADRESVGELLASTGLSDFARHYPHQLSGGMRQRAALVRTLAIKPDVLLLDEPFSALDSQTRLKLGDEVATLIRERGKTALLVTHDVAEAVSMADRVAVLSPRPAKLMAVHDVPMPGTPLERRKSAEFKEYFNLLWKELDVHVD